MTLSAEVIQKCRTAGLFPSAIETDVSEAYERAEFVEMTFDSWFAKYKPSHPHAFISEAMADLETQAFSQGNMTARTRLVQELGADQAEARAKEWGLKGFTDFKTRGKRPFGEQSNEKPKADNPWSPEGWNLTAQMRVAKSDMALAERLAKAAGSFLGATRPNRAA